jgi:UDP-N-acetylglucosamine:LPS N-acetylglucosamine transferase
MLTSHVPGQERGNTEFVVDAGAGRHTPSVRSLLRTLGELRRDPSTVDRMALASARLGNPEAAREIVDLLASLLGVQARPLTPRAFAALGGGGGSDRVA